MYVFASRGRDPEVLAEREGGHAVEEREVDPLGGEPHLAG